MVDYVIMPKQDYEEACDAIRAKTGKTDLIVSGAMADEIAEIQTGGGENKLPSVVDGTIVHITADDLKGATAIRESAFYNIDTLETVALPDTVTTIGAKAFQDCLNIKKFSMGNGVTTIGTYAFSYCERMEHIIFSAAIGNIDTYVFAYCGKMKWYDFRSAIAVPVLAAGNAFQSLGSNAKIVVPDNLYDTWVAATNWVNVSSKIVKASEVTL